MDFIPLIAPPTIGYLTTLQCNKDKISEKTTDNTTYNKHISRDIVWPTLLAFIGFAWYFSRLNNDRIDFYYVLLTLITCVWLWLSTCKPELEITAFIILIGSIYVTYKILSIGSASSSMAFLTPVILWMFFMVQFTLREIQIPSFRDIFPYKIIIEKK